MIDISVVMPVGSVEPELGEQLAALAAANLRRLVGAGALSERAEGAG